MKKQTGIRVHEDTLKQLDAIAERLHLPRNAVIQMALDEYIKRMIEREGE